MIRTDLKIGDFEKNEIFSKKFRSRYNGISEIQIGN